MIVDVKQLSSDSFNGNMNNVVEYVDDIYTGIIKFIVMISNVVISSSYLRNWLPFDKWGHLYYFGFIIEKWKKTSS